MKFLMDQGRSLTHYGAQAWQAHLAGKSSPF